MKQEIFIAERNRLIEAARRYLIRSCRFDLRRPEHVHRMREAEAVRTNCLGQIFVQAVVSSFDEMAVRENALVVDGVSFPCAALEQMKLSKIYGGFLYLLAVRKMPETGGMKRVSESFYVDSWGTAFVDAGRDLLRQRLLLRGKTHADTTLTESFGPGCYGMELSQLGAFTHVLEGSRIGLSLTESGTMEPAKSCAGFYLEVDSETVLPPERCLSCQGNRGSCNYCRSSFDFSSRT